MYQRSLNKSRLALSLVFFGTCNHFSCCMTMWTIAWHEIFEGLKFQLNKFGKSSDITTRDEFAWIEFLSGIWRTCTKFILLVCKWRHASHVGGQEQWPFSPLGTKFYFYVNSSKKFLLFWAPTWPPCHVVANQELRKLYFLTDNNIADLR